MMVKSTGKRDTVLLKMVKMRESSKVEEHRKHEVLVPYLPKDCISNILIRLPFDCLLKSRMVCKEWYNIISSSVFIDAHLRRSESVLIFQTPLVNEKLASTSTERPRMFSVERYFQSSSVPNLWQPFSAAKFSLRFVEFEDGMCKKEGFNVSCEGHIRATCNGLILLDNKQKKGGLIVLNPVTRKLITLPVGTLSTSHKESYGFALSTSLYKVVHLFYDDLDYVSCEILNLERRIWRAVNGPAYGLFRWFGYKPVSAIGALHWIPELDRSEYIVCMDVDTERFHTIMLPKSCRTYDRIVETNGFLGFVTHEGTGQIDIWILKGITGEEWSKDHCITVGSLWDMVPLFSLRINQELIFWREEDGSFYSYNFQLQVMKKVEMQAGRFPLNSSYLTHVNSLVSWSGSDMQRFV